MINDQKPRPLNEAETQALKGLFDSMDKHGILPVIVSAYRQFDRDARTLNVLWEFYRSFEKELTSHFNDAQDIMDVYIATEKAFQKAKYYLGEIDGVKVEVQHGTQP